MKMVELPKSEVEVAAKVLQVTLEDLENISKLNLKAHGVTSKEFLNSFTWSEHVGCALEFINKTLLNEVEE